MDDIINGLIEKVGLDKQQAEQVLEFLKENGPQVIEWLKSSGVAEKIKDKLPGGLGGLLG